MKIDFDRFEEILEKIERYVDQSVTVAITETIRKEIKARVPADLGEEEIEALHKILVTKHYLKAHEELPLLVDELRIEGWDDKDILDLINEVI